MFPELVVAWFALTTTAPAKTLKSPAMEFEPEIVMPDVLPNLPSVNRLTPGKAQVESKVWLNKSELKDELVGSIETMPEVLTLKPPAPPPEPNLSERIVTLEVEDCPEIAPTTKGFVEVEVAKLRPFAPKLRFMSPPFAKNWSPSARSIANWPVFTEVMSAVRLPVPEAMNFVVRNETCWIGGAWLSELFCLIERLIAGSVGWELAEELTSRFPPQVSNTLSWPFNPTKRQSCRPRPELTVTEFEAAVFAANACLPFEPGSPKILMSPPADEIETLLPEFWSVPSRIGYEFESE